MNATVKRLGHALPGFLLGLFLTAASPVVAAEPNSDQGNTSAKSVTQPDEFTSVLSECQQQARRLRGEIAASNHLDPTVARFITVELELWERLQLLTLQRKAIKEDNSAIQSDLAQIDNDQIVDGLPDSFLAVDDLRDKLVVENRRLRSLNLERESENRIILAVKQKYEQAEQLRRRSQERFERSDPRSRPARQRETALAHLQSRVLSAELELHREQSGLTILKIELLDQQVNNLEALVQANQSKFTLTRGELDGRLELIDQMGQQVRQQIAEVDARLQSSIQNRSSGSAAWSPTAYEMEREESQLLTRLLAGVSDFKDCWRRRYEISNGRGSAQAIALWVEETTQIKEEVEQIAEQLERRSQQRRDSLAKLTRDTLAQEGGGGVLDLEQQSIELNRIIDVYGQIQVLAAGGQRLCERTLEDLSARQSQFSIVEYLQLAFGFLEGAWEYELTTIDDESITVRKIVFGVFLLLCGYYISRMLASALAYRVSPKLGVTPAGAAVLRSVLFYLFVTAFAFASLEIVNVPLTIFAFLGGAVAIGVGFGSQNLINNFMSGLILLVERPIRIGDLVNVDGIDANVEHIGARSTRVRTGANLEILVPNSKFLENNVTNWTLSDTRTRTSLSVGVAYGSPVREVVKILNQVIHQHEKALDTPEPIVLFQDFADSSLVFEVHFWIHMERIMDGAKIRSEVRIAIDDAFREAGIVIAFPQRDVHIDMSEPIPVRFSEPEPRATIPISDARAGSTLTERFRRRAA